MTVTSGEQMFIENFWIGACYDDWGGESNLFVLPWGAARSEYCPPGVPAAELLVAVTLPRSRTERAFLLLLGPRLESNCPRLGMSLVFLSVLVKWVWATRAEVCVTHFVFHAEVKNVSLHHFLQNSSEASTASHRMGVDVFSYSGWRGWKVKLTIHLYPVSMLRMNGANFTLQRSSRFVLTSN